ncbi:RraA family protein [Rubritalea marina]|uniref:RraA family protein n=1 Tax=Rubritalea marina TaxID=361055 RepID=UPI000362B113|nr:RraA family protein [Rubritalea marina]
MSYFKDQIISVIKNNRISSVEVADALGKSGVIEGLRPLVSKKFTVGEVSYIYGHSKSNWPIHEQGEVVKKGGVLYVDTFDCGNHAAFGDIVAKYFILYKEIEGIVVNGLMRDIHSLIKQDYPIWAQGVTPLGCYNKEVQPTAEVLQLAEENRRKIEGGVVVCDDSGCTLIRKEQLTKDTLKRLQFIELQEDIWYYCIDTLKWSTYKTICLKAYLGDPEVLPEVLRQKLEEYNV